MKARIPLARRWLERHDNVITTADARALGLTQSDLRRLVRDGEWARIARGVYRSTSARRGPREQLGAALVANGPTAVASHLTAAWLWGLVDQAPARPHITVSAQLSAPDGERAGPSLPE